MSNAAIEAVLRRDRVIVAAAVVVLTALAWAYVWWLAADMDVGGMDMSDFRMIPAGMGLMMPATAPWTTTEFAFVFGMWAVMMIGMMTPSVAPMLLIYARVGREAAHQGKPLAASAYFAAGYLLTWIGFALVATSAQWALERAALLTPMMAGASDILGGVVDCRWPISVDAAQGRLSAAMPSALVVHSAPRRISSRRARRTRARCSPWQLLHRLLLGADGIALRRRGDERIVDRRDRDSGTGREGHSRWACDFAHRRCRAFRGRRMAPGTSTAMNGKPMSASGTELPIPNVRSSVAIGGKADKICSMRVLRILTQSGPRRP